MEIKYELEFDFERFIQHNNNYRQHTKLTNILKFRTREDVIHFASHFEGMNLNEANIVELSNQSKYMRVFRESYGDLSKTIAETNAYNNCNIYWYDELKEFFQKFEDDEFIKLLI